MKKYLSGILLLAFTIAGFVTLNATADPIVCQADTAYEITVKCKPYKNCFIVLGHFFGDEFRIDTTASVDENSEAKFTGTEKLNGGIYVIFIEGREEYFDFLISSGYPRFTIIAEFDQQGKALNLEFLNSPENELLLEYKKYMSVKEREILEAQGGLAAAENQTDSALYISELRAIDKDIRKFRSAMMQQHPSSFLSMLLNAMQEPMLPEPFRNPKNAADSSAANYHRKAHFWDGVDFWDGRLAYTPFFNSKLDRYFYEVVEWHADSVIKQIDWMMSTAVANETMEYLILDKLLYGCLYHRFKWESAVYIHLFENYVAPKTYPWLTPEIRKQLTDYAYLLMGTTQGAPAADIKLPDSEGNIRALSAMEAKYTVLSFWDPVCSHCLETLPVMDSIYRAEWAPKGIEVYTVASETEGTRGDWLQVINSKLGAQWTNVYISREREAEYAMAGESSILQKYDVWYYPAFFLLDHEKRFMAKKLSFSQLLELISSIVDK